jgi:hypothetical protein
MSIGSKKKDKDKDAKAASGGEASANYIIGGEGRVEERSTTTTGKQESVSPATANNNKLSTRDDISATQREKITSTTSTQSQDQISTEATMTTATTTAPSSSTSSTSQNAPYQYQYQQNYQQQPRWGEQQQSGINKALDETRGNIRKSIDEARREIPHYTQTVNDYQEQSIESTKEVADHFLESQKEIIDSLQSAWLPQIEAANRVFTSSWMSPRYFAQVYADIVSNFANNLIPAIRLANNMIFANMEAFRTTIQQTKANTKELSRINVNTARSLEQSAREIAEGYAPSYTPSEFYSGGRGRAYRFNQEQQQQIPSRQNEEDTQNILEAQSHIAGQKRQHTVTDLPTAAAVGQALKDVRFPADKKRILLFLQGRSNANPDYQKMVSLLDNLEDRQYQNVSDITKAADIIE